MAKFVLSNRYISAGVTLATLFGFGLSARAQTTLIGAAVNDGSFETPVQSSPGYTYQPTGTPWSFVGGAGIAASSSGFGENGPVPNGSQYGFLQVAGAGSTSTISQTFNLTSAQSLAISFDVAGRSNFGGNAVFSASLDGTVFETLSTTTGESFVLLTYNDPSIAAGNHTLTFTANEAAGATSDNTAYVDGVNVIASAATAPEPGVLLLLSSGLPVAGVFAFRKQASKR